MLRFSLFALFTVSISISQSQAQIIGLWHVESVIVGAEEMTPQAKWFDLREDSTVMGGNGNIINIMGTWSYRNDTLIFADEYGENDPFGGFDALVKKDKMIWNRREEGQSVTVNLTRVFDYPKALWDLASGGWRPANPEDETTIWMGWDRQYRINSNRSRKRGIWHIGAHNNELKLVGENGVIETWEVDFPTDSTMVWSDNLKGLKEFIRLRE